MEKAADLEGSPAPASKKAQKKAEKAATKEARKAERLTQAAAAFASETPELVALGRINEAAFGDLELCQSQGKSGRDFVAVRDLDARYVGRKVWIRCRLHESRCKGALGFLLLRQKAATVQAVISAKGENGFPKQGIKWAAGLPLECVLDIQGLVTEPEVALIAPSQKVELQVLKLFCVAKTPAALPFQLKDASRPDDAAEEEGQITVGQDTRLDNRVLDLRTPANQAIFVLQSAVCKLFRDYLTNKGFVEIHTPKLIGGASEGGANVFNLQYFNRPACLAQSPQLHKQMAICADFDRVFEIGPVFRAENSNTHRHLCEFTGLDLEMAIREHYDEILDLLNDLFLSIFEGLQKDFQTEIGVIHQQHPNRPFRWLSQAPRLTFEEAVKLIRDSGESTGVPSAEDLAAANFDLSTEQEKLLGRIVGEKYGTDFFMVTRYPTTARPFYTMTCADDARWTNSYDLFMRGEEIVSGAQRVHDADLLIKRLKEMGVNPATVQNYVDAFRLGAPPHGGAGIGLERVVMLFLGLGNIRKASMFPRDPKRLAP